jgi:hypothetical protein
MLNRCIENGAAWRKFNINPVPDHGLPRQQVELQKDTESSSFHLSSTFSLMLD